MKIIEKYLFVNKNEAFTSPFFSPSKSPSRSGGPPITLMYLNMKINISINCFWSQKSLINCLKNLVPDQRLHYPFTLFDSMKIQALQFLFLAKNQVIGANNKKVTLNLLKHSTYLDINNLFLVKYTRCKASYLCYFLFHPIMHIS